MELWKKIGIIFGIVGALYGFGGLAPLFIIVGGPPRGGINPMFIAFVFFSLSTSTLVAMTVIIEKLRLPDYPIFGYIVLIINALLWSLIFTFVGIKIGRFIEKRRAKATAEKIIE